MEKRVIILLLCISYLLIQGCNTASTFKLKPEAVAEQKMMPREGFDTVVSHKKNSSVMVRAASNTFESGDHPAIVLGLFSEKEFDISNNDIKAFIDGQPLKVMTNEELVKEIRDNYKAGLKAIEEQYSQQTRQAVETSKKNPNDPAVRSESALDGPGIVGNSWKSQYRIDYDQISAGQHDAATKADADIEVLKDETAKNLKKVLSSSLVEGTVEPGTWHRGKVTLARIPGAGKPHNIKVVVTVQGEDHEFLFKTSK